MRELSVLPWDEVVALTHQPQTLVWAIPLARERLGWPHARWINAALPVAGAQTVIAIGGGSHLDHAKLHWREVGASRLIAVPTLWGSGAEASPVAVWTEGGQKRFQLDERLRPHAIAFFDAFVDSVPEERARAACGDTWSHALEGFLSPLASDALRTELAGLIRELLTLPLGADPRWFPVSARAAAGQAESSVGLVHGLAHTLEPLVGVDHASLCSLFLAPVLRFNLATSEKWTALTTQYGLDAPAILARVASLSTPAARMALAPQITEHWKKVLRDPCTRTNSALVRPDSLPALLAALEVP